MRVFANATKVTARGGTGSGQHAATTQSPAPTYQGHRLTSIAIHAPRLQPVLVMGAVDDPAEREADAAADRVMRMAEPMAPMLRMPKPAQVGVGPGNALPRIQRMCPECEEEIKRKIPMEKLAVQAKREDVALEEGASAIAPYVNSLLGRGEPLAPSTRAFFEPRFGVDFSAVRIHTGPEAHRSAEQINAMAYTTGPHVVFRAGHYDPASQLGRRLLAHELAHVVQQGGAHLPGNGGTTLLQRAEFKFGGLTIQIDYSSVVRVADAAMASQIEALITTYTGAAPSAATKTAIAAMSNVARKWMMFGLKLLVDNTKAAHAALDRAKAVDRMVSAAPTALETPLPDADQRFVREVLRVSGWFEVALTSGLSKPTGTTATEIKTIVNPPPSVGSPGDPLDVAAFKSRLEPALKHFLTKIDPAAWTAKGTRSISAFQTLGDKLIEEARAFFSPFADTARSNLFSLQPAWHPSANIFDTGTFTPDTDDRISYLLNRAEIVGRRTEPTNTVFIDSKIFAETKFDGSRAADQAELVSLVTTLEADPTVKGQVNRLLQHTGQKSGIGAATRIGLVTEFEATATTTACKDHWAGIRTLCHELLHALSHPDFDAAATKVKFPQVIREGFTEVLGVQLFNDHVKPKAKSDATFKAALEAGVAGAPCPEPADTTIKYGDAGAGAKKIHDKVGDNNFRAAYFLGRPDLAGIPIP
jgi:hypothetical protein